MSALAKVIFILLGIKKTHEHKPVKKNATKFSKSLKQSIAQDARELALKIELKQAS